MVRELREETGLHVTVTRLLGTRPLEVIPDTWVDVVAYECQFPTSVEPHALNPSDEHTRLAFLDPAAVPDDELPQAYRELIALC